MEEQRYSTVAAAKRLGIARQTLVNWRFQKKGPAYHKIGGQVFYFESDLKAYEQSGRVEPGAENFTGEKT